MKRTVVTSKVNKKPFVFTTNLRVGDSVMIIAGGNKAKGKALKGQVGTLKKILPKSSRVIVDGLNLVSKHKRAANSQEESGVIKKESPMSISNVMFYSEKLKRPFRLKVQKVGDGEKSRGFLHPETGMFEAI